MKHLSIFLSLLFSLFLLTLNAQTVEVLQDFDVAQLRMESKVGGGSGTVINMLGVEDSDTKLLRMIYEKNELVPPDGPIEFAWEVGHNVGFGPDPDFFGIGHYTFNLDFIFKEAAIIIDNENMFTGIGTLTPDARLHVYNNDNFDSDEIPAALIGEFPGSIFDYGYLTVDQPDTDDNTNIARFRDDGITQVWINRGASTYQLTVFGDALASGGVWINSDKRLKKDIQTIPYGLANLKKLKPSSYYFKRDTETNSHLPEEFQFGLIAQDVQKVFPNLVRESDQKNEEGEVIGTIHSVNYIGLIPVLVQSVQELDQQLLSRTDEVASLRAENSALIQRMERLEKIVAALSKDD